MGNHEAGRESLILRDIKLGLKTVEGRLATGKFLDFKAGDYVELREDFYENGVIMLSKPKQAISEVIEVQKYDTFKKMLQSVGVHNVLPRAKDIDEALSEYRKFYSEEDETKYGVLAIHFKLVS
jgi:ASC-1-like (ASCH) protein